MYCRNTTDVLCAGTFPIATSFAKRRNTTEKSADKCYKPTDRDYASISLRLAEFRAYV